MKRSKAAAVIFLALIVAGGIGSARADTLISGVNFTASTQLDSGFTPPDVMGAVGPNHIVEFINGRYAVYTKSGQFLQASSLNNFWSSAGAVPAGSYAFDPRILYDSSIQRWYATAADNARGKNNLLFAVSKSADPTAGWWGFKIDPDSSNLRWADFPTLGYNRDAVYLAATLYPIASGSTATTLVVLPKADLLGPVPAISAMTKFEALNPSSTGYVVQPGVNQDSGSSQTLLSDYNTPAGYLKTTSLSGPATSPVLDTANGFITTTACGLPALAGQPGSKQDIHAGDNRFSSGVVSQGGLLWAVQTVEQDGHTALRWVKIDATTNTLKQEGFIADSNLDFYYGSIAVNNAGKVVVGFNGSGGDQFISAYAVLGETDAAGLTVFGTPLLLKGGVADYQGLDGAGRNRWGDYSATMIDPDSPNSFWTFQEWVAAPDLWAIQITELRVVPLPSTLLLMASGLMGLWAAARRNRRK